MEVFMLEEMEKWNKEQEAYGNSDEKHFMLGETFLFYGVLNNLVWVFFFVYMMS